MAERDDEKRRKKRRVYTTALVNEMLKELDEGYEIPMDAFFEKDRELRNAGVPFRMTDEEMEEYQKCYDDPIYFVETYCKFMTDDGQRAVKLRDYQKDVITDVTSENYDEVKDRYLPKNRGYIWMASRQSAKCLCGKIYTKTLDLKGTKNEETFLDLYYKNRKKTLLDKVKIFFYKRYEDGLKNVFGRLISLIESYELRHLDLDESDDSKKIIDSRPIDISVLTDTGYHPATHIHRTQPYTVYDVEFSDGSHIEGADHHTFYRIGLDGFVYPTRLSDLAPGDSLFADNASGCRFVRSVTRRPYRLCMYDLTVNSPDHRYYANGILSHNTTTIVSFFTWMLVFHYDKNILVVANKEDTAKEIVDKITNVFRGLPYFLKPGCINIGKMGMKLENGSRIVSSATTKTASIGFTIHCLLLDEFAHIPENIVSSFWRSVYPTLSSSEVSQCIITSTPNGTTNKFYELWTNDRNSFLHRRTDYWQVPGHDDAWAAQQRIDFGEEEFAQEFELQFNVNSRLLASASSLQFIERASRDFVYKPLATVNPFMRDKNMRWHPDFDPNDIKDEDAFVILVDLAEGTGSANDLMKNSERHPDFNAFSVWKVMLNSPSNMLRFSNTSCVMKDAFRFVQVGVFETNDQDEIYTANVCAGIAYDVLKGGDTERVRVGVEMNFNGKSFVVQFQRHPKHVDGILQRTYHKKPIPGENTKRKIGIKTGTDKDIFCKKGNRMLEMRRIVPMEMMTKTQIGSFGYIKGKIKGIACKDDFSYPAFAYIPKMMDDTTFIEWLEEVYDGFGNDWKKKRISAILKKVEEYESEMDDEQFSAIYDMDEPGSGYMPEGLGGIMSPDRNPYSENFRNGFG